MGSSSLVGGSLGCRRGWEMSGSGSGEESGGAHDLRVLVFVQRWDDAAIGSEGGEPPGWELVTVESLVLGEGGNASGANQIKNIEISAHNWREGPVWRCASGGSEKCPFLAVPFAGVPGRG